MSKAIKLTVLKIARSVGIFRLFRFLTASQVRILCYHGGAIGDEHRLNSLLFCPTAHFESRLQWLLDNEFNIIKLDDAIAMLGSDQPRPKLPTVLSFDDGWYSTYKGLHPVLQQYNLPATLYLCTQYFVRGAPNLEVTVSYILWKAPPREVEIQGFGATVDGRHDTYSTQGKTLLTSSFRAWLEGHCATRQEFCLALERFALQLGVSAEELDLSSRRFDFVTLNELTQLADQGWSIELHGHTHRYPVGKPEELNSDILKCRTEIRNAGLPNPQHYCYPSGDYDDAAHHLLSKLEVKSATTCAPGLIQCADDKQKFYLSRFLDEKNISPLEFESEMSGFSDFLRKLFERH